MAQAVYSLENEGAMSNRSRFVVQHCFVHLPRICHHCGRAFPKQAGFTKVSNLTGGITAWAERIDPEMAKY